MHWSVHDPGCVKTKSEEFKRCGIHSALMLASRTMRPYRLYSSRRWAANSAPQIAVGYRPSVTSFAATSGFCSAPANHPATREIACSESFEVESYHHLTPSIVGR